MDPVAPSTLHYIKLGAGGRWETSALERDRLEWGLPSDPHEPALAEDWYAVSRAYIENGAGKATATGYTNEARAFYTGDSEAVWITFARGRMWWAMAGPEVHWSGGDGGQEATRYRAVPGGWRDCDITGTPLDLERLSTRLTRLAGYRRTICNLSPDQQQLALRYINAAQDPEQVAVANARAELRRSLTVLIQRLSWSDFEELVDLALARTGWIRISDLGGMTKDVDLIVEQPLTGDRMAVQVKSSADQRTVDDYARRLGEHSLVERRLLICHSPIGRIEAPPANGDRRLELMLDEAVTDLSIRAGLTDWIINRAV
jgi:hypothetical protein